VPNKSNAKVLLDVITNIIDVNITITNNLYAITLHVLTSWTLLDVLSGINGQFVYSITNSSDSRNFAIDVNTGVITTQATLDRETQEFYTLISE